VDERESRAPEVTAPAVAVSAIPAMNTATATSTRVKPPERRRRVIVEPRFGDRRGHAAAIGDFGVPFGCLRGLP
jgi:hypothetical protein